MEGGLEGWRTGRMEGWRAGRLVLSIAEGMERGIFPFSIFYFPFLEGLTVAM
jgi:hypothetical protein